MLDKLFTYVLDLTVPASIVIILVLLLRLMLKGQKKIWSYALWLVVLLRLLIPAGIALPVGDLAVPAFTSRYTLSDAYVPWPDAIEAIVENMDGDPSASVEGFVDGSIDRIPCDVWELYVLVGKNLWLAGVIAVLLWAGVRYWRLKRKLREAVLLQDNVYILDGITTPFVLGLLRPKIYLPSGLKEQEQAHILLHEQRHIDRDDHIFRVVAFLVLCLHWFNPLVWMAFMLSGRDMEMSCDEAVTRHMDGDERADYAQCLLRCTAGKAHIAGMPLAFSEGDTGKRIRNLANWKKPVLWLCILAVALSVPLVFIRPASAAEPVEMVYDRATMGVPKEPVQFAMQEFPDVTFEIYATSYKQDNKIRTEIDCRFERDGKIIHRGMGNGPINKAFLADLNGDGYREICFESFENWLSTFRQISIYDIKQNRCYWFDAKGKKGVPDYVLGIENGSLVVERTLYSHDQYWDIYKHKQPLTASGTKGQLWSVGSNLVLITEDDEVFLAEKARSFYGKGWTM